VSKPDRERVRQVEEQIDRPDLGEAFAGLTQKTTLASGVMIGGS